MIEDLVIGYLNTSGIAPAYPTEPEDKPDEYFVVTRSALSERNHIQTATVHIWSYSNGIYNASALDKRLRDCMKNLISLDQVSRCRLENSFIDIDTTRHIFRYRAEFDVVFFE